MNKNIYPRDEKGNPHGYWEMYYPNGQLWYKGYYVRGLRYGYYEEFSTNYKVINRVIYIHGKQYGCFNAHWDCGQYFKKGYYHMGVEVHQTNKNKLLL